MTPAATKATRYGILFMPLRVQRQIRNRPISLTARQRFMPRSPALARVSTVNPDGNKRLTAAVGVLLLAPVLLEIATVLLGVHTFMSWHVFVGIALIPLVVLKLATTGWR